jgi:tRNA A-37 threonylcarbamoyl transferase component Bud32
MSHLSSHPDGFVRPKSLRTISGTLRCLCRPEIAEDLALTYESHTWIYDAFEEQRGVQSLRGRRPVLAGQLGETDVVVKRLSHGGTVANLWKDRFLGSGRITSHIPLAEYLTSHGIATPRVLFASWRRSWGVVRGEVGFEKLAGGVDADRYLFVSDEPPEDWNETAERIGRLVADMHRLNFLHSDLNLMNIHIGPGDQIYILDLDNSALPNGSIPAGARRRNFERLVRSIRKQGRGQAHEYVESIIETVRHAYVTAPSASNG